MLMHVAVPYMHFLKSKQRSPWLSLSSGVALAYVFIYLLPKIASSQAKVNELSSQVIVIDQSIIWFLAFMGLLTFYWAGWVADEDNKVGRTKNRTLLLYLGGFCPYFAQLGYLVADIPILNIPNGLMIACILLLHSMGINHGIRHNMQRRYDRFLRWAFAASTLAGWLLCILIDDFANKVSYWDAFIGGGIIITALKEELPHQSETRFGPLLLGAFGATGLIFLIAYFS